MTVISLRDLKLKQHEKRYHEVNEDIKKSLINYIENHINILKTITGQEHNDVFLDAFSELIETITGDELLNSLYKDE